MGVARVHEMHSNYLFHILIFLKLLLGITLDAIQKLVIILILLPSQNHGKGCSFFNLPMVKLLYCTVQYNEIVYICKFGQTFLARSPFF